MVSDRDRRSLHVALERELGEGPATTLMELLPPVGWSDVARRSDLVAIGGEIAELRGELKTDMLERLETIRSKSSTAVAQEMWGLLIAYNLIRLEMQRLAVEFGVSPTRISFIASLRHCVEQWHLAGLASPGRIPGHLATATDRMRTFVLPPRRPGRVFPRAVKIKMSNYARKLPTKSSSKKRAK